MTHIETPVYGEKNPVTCVTGRANTALGIQIAVFTVIDPTDPVTLTINGVDYVSGVDPGFTLIARGSPTVCWTVGLLLDASALTPATHYGWAVTQAGNTDAGQFWVEPNDTITPLRIESGGCDNNTQLSNLLNVRPYVIPATWQYMKARAIEADPPTAGCADIGDIGYVDRVNIRDDGSEYSFGGESGFISSGDPSTTGALNDYLIGWCALLGMLGPDKTDYSDAELQNNYLLKVLWAREENRAWCRKNLNQWKQKNDHESRDDEGWDKEPTGTTWDNANAAWDAFYGLLHPGLDGVASPRDTTARHWAFKLGGVVLVSLDSITNAARTWGSNAQPQQGLALQANFTQFTSLHGNNQIDDILEAIDTLAGDLTVMLLGNSLRYPLERDGADTAPRNIAGLNYAYEFNSLCQHPIYDHCLPEYQRLFTDEGNTPQSIMANPRTNGLAGAFMTLHYDMHHGCALYMHHPAYTDATYGSQLAERFMQVNPGATNGSAYFEIVEPERQYQGLDTGCETLTYVDEAHLNSSDPNMLGCHILQHDNGRLFDVVMTGIDDETLWDARYVKNCANMPLPMDWPTKIRFG